MSLSWPNRILAQLWQAIHFQPTAARPGTPQKIHVMRQRVLRGVPAQHPQDARLALDEGYAPVSRGGELLAGLLVREQADGSLTCLAEMERQDRPRTSSEKQARGSSTYQAQERQRARQRRRRKRQETAS